MWKCNIDSFSCIAADEESRMKFILVGLSASDFLDNQMFPWWHLLSEKWEWHFMRCTNQLVLEKVFALATDWCLFLQSAVQYCAQPNMQTWCAWNAGGIRPHDYLWRRFCCPLQTAPPDAAGVCGVNVQPACLMKRYSDVISSWFMGNMESQQSNNICSCLCTWFIIYAHLLHGGGGGVSEISKQGWTHPSIF